MTRVLCTADWHIGAGTEYADDRLADTDRVLGQIRALAVERRVDLIAHAGDVFHRPRPTPSEMHVFSRFVRSLPCPMIAVLGNSGHDQDGHGRPTALELFASGPDGLTVAREPRVYSYGGVDVCTLPSVPTSLLAAQLDTSDRGHVYEQAAEHLTAVAKGLRDDCRPDVPNLLLAHWSVTGANLPNGLPVADLHEPVLEIGALERLGFDAIVAGHIHLGQFMAVDRLNTPTSSFYCGTPMVTNYGEAQHEHGCYILTLNEGGELIRYVEFVPLTDRPFVTYDLDFTDGEDFSQLLEHYGDWTHLQDAVVRVRYRASEEDHRRVDQAAVKQALLDLGAHRVYQITPEILRATRARAEGVDESLSPFAAVTAWTDANEIPMDMADTLRVYASTLIERSGL